MGVFRMLDKTEKGLFSTDPYAKAVIDEVPEKGLFSTESYAKAVIDEVPVKGWRLVVTCRALHDLR